MPYYVSLYAQGLVGAINELEQIASPERDNMLLDFFKRELDKLRDIYG